MVLPAKDASVADAVEQSLKAAAHLTDLDAGSVQVLRGLAASVDYLNDHDGLNESGRFDNVTVPTFLRYCEQLGLTPAGRKALEEKKKDGSGGSSGVAARRARHLKSA